MTSQYLNYETVTPKAATIQADNSEYKDFEEFAADLESANPVAWAGSSAGKPTYAGTGPWWRRPAVLAAAATLLLLLLLGVGLGVGLGLGLRDNSCVGGLVKNGSGVCVYANVTENGKCSSDNECASDELRCVGAQSGNDDKICCGAGKVKDTNDSNEPYCRPCRQGTYFAMNTCKACVLDDDQTDIQAECRGKCDSCDTMKGCYGECKKTNETAACEGVGYTVSEPQCKAYMGAAGQPAATPAPSPTPQPLRATAGSPPPKDTEAAAGPRPPPPAPANPQPQAPTSAPAGAPPAGQVPASGADGQ